MVISPGWLASFGAVSIPRLVGLDPRIEFFNLSSNLEAGARERVWEDMKILFILLGDFVVNVD